LLSSVKALHCITLLAVATLKFAVFCCFYEAKLCLSKFILLHFFSQLTPLHLSACFGHLEVTRLLVESKADVAARERCFSPPPSHHLSLTICLAAGATLHSKMPSRTTKPTLLHTCAASTLLNEAPTSVTCPQNGSSKRLQSKSSSSHMAAARGFGRAVRCGGCAGRPPFVDRRCSRALCL
jgi:hypothetical protein